MSKGLRIFVLADTHNKLPQKVVDFARDGDEIWHLGDVCEPTITDDLSAVGPPLTVVRGNCDWNTDWPLVIDLTRDGLKFRLEHIPPDVLPDDVDVVLHGHTHVPRNERRSGVLFLFRLLLLERLFLNDHGSIDPFDERHRSGIAFALTEPHDAGVTAVTLSRSGCNLVEQFFDGVLVPQSRESSASGVN